MVFCIDWNRDSGTVRFGHRDDSFDGIAERKSNASDPSDCGRLAKVPGQLRHGVKRCTTWIFCFRYWHR